MGTLDFRSIAEPVRASLPHVTFEQGKVGRSRPRGVACAPPVSPPQCRAIDPVAKTIDVLVHYGAVRGGTEDLDYSVIPNLKAHTMSYDALVIAVGARNNTFNIPGKQWSTEFTARAGELDGLVVITRICCVCICGCSSCSAGPVRRREGERDVPEGAGGRPPHPQHNHPQH